MRIGAFFARLLEAWKLASSIFFFFSIKNRGLSWNKWIGVHLGARICPIASQQNEEINESTSNTKMNNDLTNRITRANIRTHAKRLMFLPFFAATQRGITTWMMSNWCPPFGTLRSRQSFRVGSAKKWSEEKSHRKSERNEECYYEYGTCVGVRLPCHSRSFHHIEHVSICFHRFSANCRPCIYL